MGLEFRITSEIPQGKPHVAVLHLSGWLDAHSEGQLVEAVERAKQEGAQFLLLDLAGVTTITSAGLRGIQKSFGIMTPKGDPNAGRFKLCGAAPQVYEVLSTTGLLISIPMYEGADIAIDSFGA